MMGSSLLRSGVPLLLALGLVWSCGSGTAKKKTMMPDEGDGGEAGQTSEPRGGTGGKGGGTGGKGGTGGGAVGAEAGAAGVAEGGASGESGEGGSGGAAPEFHGLYVGTEGLDTNGGSHEEPFLTLAHAVTVAQAGDTIVFLDGTFAASNGVTIPAGVNVMAEHTGLAKLACSFQNLFTFAGSSRIEGLEFDACPQPIVAITSGTLDMVDLLLVSGGTEQGAVRVGGTVVATLSGASDHVFTQGGSSLFVVGDTASLTVTNGIYKNTNQNGVSGSGLFRAANSAKLSLKDVTIVDVLQTPLSAADNATLTLDHVTVDSGANFAVLLRNTATFTAKNNTHLALKPTAAPRYECVRSELTGGSIVITDSEITGGSTGINSTLPATLTINNSKLHHNDGLAIDLAAYAMSAPVSNVTITNTEISDNGSVVTQIHGGIRIGGNILNMKLRKVTFKDIGGTYGDATDMYLTASNGSSFDFGTLADPGLNTFQTNTLGSGVRFQSGNQAGSVVQAVGNVWAPNLQGAGPDGKYAPIATAKTFDVVGPVIVNSGPANYQLSTSVTLRLAEIP